MERDETFAPFDILQEGFFLIGCDGIDIGVNHQAVVASEVAGIEGIGFVGVNQIDSARGEDGLQLPEPLGGPVMTVVAEEEDLDRFRFRGKQRAAVMSIAKIMYRIEETPSPRRRGRSGIGEPKRH